MDGDSKEGWTISRVVSQIGVSLRLDSEKSTGGISGVTIGSKDISVSEVGSLVFDVRISVVESLLSSIVGINVCIESVVEEEVGVEISSSVGEGIGDSGAGIGDSGAGI
ncbi:MAG: hypothetical protein LBG52_04950 [Candidatus Peribacteria bacterium]|nr:hypothetical protein [Candidatus Peribacteria bacterium]